MLVVVIGACPYYKVADKNSFQCTREGPEKVVMESRDWYMLISCLQFISLSHLPEKPQLNPIINHIMWLLIYIPTLVSSVSLEQFKTIIVEQ